MLSYHVAAHSSCAICSTNKHLVRLLGLVDHADFIVAILNKNRTFFVIFQSPDQTQQPKALLLATKSCCTAYFWIVDAFLPQHCFFHKGLWREGKIHFLHITRNLCHLFFDFRELWSNRNVHYLQRILKVHRKQVCLSHSCDSVWLSSQNHPDGCMDRKREPSHCLYNLKQV